MATGRVPTTANSPLTAKGDLFGYSTAPARLAVGNDGEQIVADSSTSTGLRYQSNFTAGKNKFLNSDMTIAQRGTSITLGASGYTLDRYFYAVATAVPTGTISQQTFTPGTAPVAGYEGSNFLRVNITANNGCTVLNLENRIEDVRTLAGQTATFSFWAKADAASTIGSVTLSQNFGSGGSATVNTAITLSTSSALTTGWVRATGTISVPSISGKTIGTSSYLTVILGMPTSAGVVRNGTYDFWGWQLEAGSVATTYETATGTIQGELAACQRYYYRLTADTTYAYLAFGMATTTTNGKVSIPAPSTMRVVPTAIDSPTASTLRFTDGVTGTTCNSSPTLDGDTTNELLTFNTGVASGLTQYRPIWFSANNSASAYIGFSAEL